MLSFSSELDLYCHCCLFYLAFKQPPISLSRNIHQCSNYSCWSDHKSAWILHLPSTTALTDRARLSLPWPWQLHGRIQRLSSVDEQYKELCFPWSLPALSAGFYGRFICIRMMLLRRRLWYETFEWGRAKAISWRSPREEFIPSAWTGISSMILKDLDCCVPLAGSTDASDAGIDASFMKWGFGSAV